MRATGGWAQRLDAGVTVCVHTNTAEVRPLWPWPDVMSYKSRDRWGQISTHKVKRLTTPKWGAAEKWRIHGKSGEFSPDYKVYTGVIVELWPPQNSWFCPLSLSAAKPPECHMLTGMPSWPTFTQDYFDCLWWPSFTPLPAQPSPCLRSRIKRRQAYLHPRIPNVD